MKQTDKQKTHKLIHENMHSLSVFMATEMKTDTNVLSLYFTYTHITKTCRFLTTPICWDFTDQTAGFQLASHNYAPRLPFHPLPLLSLLLTLLPSSSPTPTDGLQLRMGGAVKSSRMSKRLIMRGKNNDKLVERGFGYERKLKITMKIQLEYDEME